MRIRPDGAELLRAARVTLHMRIVPLLTPDLRSCVATVERAMAKGEEKLTYDVDATQAELGALENARVSMRDVILPALPAERSYDARLVAKAIAIASSQLARGNASDVREVQRLAALLKVPVPVLGDARDVRCTLFALSERLSNTIRNGAADEGSEMHDATLAHLEAITREALSESNPKYRRLVAVAAAASGPPRSGKPQPLPVVAGVDVSAPFGGVVEAFCATSMAAFATQAAVFGYVAERAAANPNVPTFVVESAHQLHDFSVAFAETSATLSALILAPWRGLGGFEGSQSR